MNADSVEKPSSELRTAIAIFVKTPGLSSLKSRLARTLGQEDAETFYRYSCQATADSCRLAGEQVSGTDIFWAVAEEEALYESIWQEFPRIFQGSGSLGSRLASVHTQLQADFDRLIFLGGDCPQLSPLVLADIIRQLRTEPGYVVGPASDGGFWLWGGPGKHSAVSFWQRVPYSQSSTRSHLVKELRNMGRVRLGAEYRDVDTIEDLQSLATHLLSRNDLTVSQQTLQQWIRLSLPELFSYPPTDLLQKTKPSHSACRSLHS
ncbi:MAG: DUF2064 domain-containing protein [Deltaproteobacteria bacterium]|nr:DUF2064 domain-containing protein [Deltaproteobacteria bacterium]